MDQGRPYPGAERRVPLRLPAQRVVGHVAGWWIAVSSLLALWCGMMDQKEFGHLTGPPATIAGTVLAGWLGVSCGVALVVWVRWGPHRLCGKLVWPQTTQGVLAAPIAWLIADRTIDHVGCLTVEAAAWREGPWMLLLATATFAQGACMAMLLVSTIRLAPLAKGRAARTGDNAETRIKRDATKRQ